MMKSKTNLLRKFIARGNSLYSKLTVNEWRPKVASGGQVKASLCGGCLQEYCTRLRKHEANVRMRICMIMCTAKWLFSRFSAVWSGLSCSRAKKSPLPKRSFYNTASFINATNLLDCKIVFNQADRTSHMAFLDYKPNTKQAQVGYIKMQEN